MNTKIIKLDINKKLYETISAKQGDTESRFLLFHIFDSSLPFDLREKSVRVYGIKPDDTKVFNDLVINDAEKGYCTLELTNQILAIAGLVKLELVIYNGNKKLSSIPFVLNVISSLNSDDAVVSTNEFTALMNGLAALSEYDIYKSNAKQVPGIKEEVSNLSSQLEQMEQDKATKLEVEIERKRIDNLSKLGEASTTGDAELQDIRVGIDGISYDSAGNAVREQFKNESLKSDNIIDFNTSIYPSTSKSGDFINIINANNAPLTIKRKVKNLLPLTKEHIKSRLSWFTWTSDTEFNGDGIYYKINDNGTITANGTATKNIGIAICSIDNLDPNRIYCCSDENGGVATTYFMEFALERKDQNRGSIKSFDNIKTFNLVDKITAWLVIKSGQTLNNVVFKPMLEVGETAHTYVPYTNTKIISCKNNLLKFDTKTIVEKGVTIETIDNSIYIKGTANDDISICLGEFNASEYQYTCFENRMETSENTFYLTFNGGNFEQDRGQLFSYNASEKKFSTPVNQILIWLNIKNGVKVNNILEPMISRDVLNYERYEGNEILVTNTTKFPNKNLPTYKDLTNIFDTGGAVLEIEYIEDFDINFKKLNEVAIKNNEMLNEVGVYEKFEGDIITISEHDTNYFKITKANTDSKIILCKNNLLKIPSKEVKVNGVVITVNEDSTITLKGTSTSSIWYGLYDMELPSHNYYCIEGTGLTKNQKFNIQFWGTMNGQDRGYLESNGNEKRFASNVDKIGVVINMESGVTVDVTLKPMISLENIEYEKYIGKEIKISDLKNDIFELFEGTNNIFSSDKSTIGVKLLKNTTQKFNKLEKEIKYNVNYNNVPLIKNKNGVRKSVNEDEQGNLKLFDISNNVIGRSKYNGNTYVVEYWGTELEIIDPNGARIFSKTISQAPLFLFNKVKNSKGQIRFTYGVHEGDSYGVAGFEPQKWNIVDENFSPIKEKITLIGNGSTITDGAACDNHVFNYIDDNHYIITGYLPYIADDIPGLPGRYKVVNCVIQEIKDNKVIFEWESKNHPELYTLSVESNKYETTPASGTSYSDYCHINAVATDKNNDFIISCRNVGIMKISRSTKSIEWLFGRGGRIDFTGMNIGDTGFLQHDIRIQKDGSITIFDNSGCATDNSRVCRYWLDESTMTMTKFKEYKTHRPRSKFMGSALLLDDDTETFLISYGGQQGILYDEINFSTGETNMTVLSERTKGCSYCALRDLDEVKY